MFGRLSDDTVRRRFLVRQTELSDVEAAFFADVDHNEREAIAAVQDGNIIGVARYDRVTDDTAEVAIVVQDDKQRQGHGTVLALFLMDRAIRSGIRYLAFERLGDNRAVTALIGSLGLQQFGESLTNHGITAEMVQLPASK